MKYNKKSMKWLRLSVLLLAVATALVGFRPTNAWMQKTDSKTNTFWIPVAGISVDETFAVNVDGKMEKSNVAVQNTGTETVYIRVRLIACQYAADGSLIFSEDAVTGAERYTLTLNEEGWVKGSDGCHYYQQPVGKDAATSVLIQSCTTNLNNFQLNVYVQAIAADSLKENNDLWSVTFSENVLTPKQ